MKETEKCCSQGKETEKCYSQINMKSKKRFFKNIDSSNNIYGIFVNRTYPTKVHHQKKINLVEVEKIITDNKKLAEVFNYYFCNITKTLRFTIIGK